MQVFCSSSRPALVEVRRLVRWKSVTIRGASIIVKLKTLRFLFSFFFSSLESQSQLLFLASCTMLTCAWTATSCLKVRFGVMLSVSRVCFNEMQRNAAQRSTHNSTPGSKFSVTKLLLRVLCALMDPLRAKPEGSAQSNTSFVFNRNRCLKITWVNFSTDPQHHLVWQFLNYFESTRWGQVLSSWFDMLSLVLRNYIILACCLLLSCVVCVCVVLPEYLMGPCCCSTFPLYDLLKCEFRDPYWSAGVSMQNMHLMPGFLQTPNVFPLS